MKILLQETHAQVFHDEKQHFIEIRIQEGISKNDYQFAYEHALVAAKTNNVKKFLINEGVLVSSSYALKTWFAINFLPRFFSKLGLNVQLAVVRRKNKITSLSSKIIDKAHNTLKAKFQLEFFEDDEKAVDWLTIVVKKEIR